MNENPKPEDPEPHAQLLVGQVEEEQDFLLGVMTPPVISKPCQVGEDQA